MKTGPPRRVAPLGLMFAFCNAGSCVKHEWQEPINGIYRVPEKGAIRLGNANAPNHEDWGRRLWAYLVAPLDATVRGCWAATR